VGAIVDEEEFDRLEELSSHIVAATSRLPGFAQDAAQFVQKRLAARNAFTAPGCVFKSLNQ